MHYSNMNHSCPYVGLIFVKVENISINTFVFEQLLPAGRYRCDFNLSTELKKPILMGKIYASISDHRIEQF